MQRTLFTLILGLALVPMANADSPGHETSWRDLVSHGESLVFGRFMGKFESPEFTSRRVRIRDSESGEEKLLNVDDGMGYIAEALRPGTYSVIGIEAVYVPQTRPFKPDKYRPIRQKFGVRPKTGDVGEAVLIVPSDRPVYIGTIEAAVAVDGVVYRGHQLRVYDDYDDAVQRLTNFYPRLAQSLEHDGIAPARHFILKPTRRPDPLESVVGAEDPIRQAREYITEHKYKQAVAWLETFMPTNDNERNEVRLLVGEALLGDRRYGEAIEELGEVLLSNPKELRALRLLARAHAQNKNLPDAQNLYEALAEAVPDDTEAHLYLGYLYALKDQKEKSLAEFGAAFRTDFDYLLHDIMPFALAMKKVYDDEEGTYVPPRIVKFDVPPPKEMDSRRSGRSSSIVVLVDHKGKVVAATLGGDSAGQTPLLMVSLVRATYTPASLNGIPVPAVLFMGEEEEAGK
ncbi:MAG TPA: tetratricopeptide repeat protein [Vicinamibacteria bacterium]